MTKTIDVIMISITVVIVIAVGLMLVEQSCWNAVEFCYDKQGVQYAGDGITIDCSKLIHWNTSVSTCSEYWNGA